MWCNFHGLKGTLIKMYSHENGWQVDGHFERQWLYITCPKCKYDWALWKLGVPRGYIPE
jgi:hypothetical protein